MEKSPSQEEERKKQEPAARLMDEETSEEEEEKRVDDDKASSGEGSPNARDDSLAPEEHEGEEGGGEGDPEEDYYNSTSSALSDDRWEEMHKRLLDFKEVHGHCLVPNRYKEDLQLGAWVSAQRKNYKLIQSGSGKSTPMTMERARRLMDVGFEWTAKNPRHLMWEVRFAELKDFKSNYGHAQVPIGWEQNVQLANWVSTQRQEYKNLIKGKTSRLNDKRVNLLNSLGFAWELQRGGRRRRLAVNKGGANGTSPAAVARPPHPADKAERGKEPPTEDSFPIDDGTPVKRVAGARKRTTLKKKLTSVDGTSKCILPGVAIMGGGREVSVPRPSPSQERNTSGSGRRDSHGPTSAPSPMMSNNRSGGGGGMQQNQQPHTPMQQQQQQQQGGYPNGFFGAFGGGNPNPWQMLPNGAYQQMSHPFAHLMGGPMGMGGPSGNPFFPMAPGPYGMHPYGGGGGMGGGMGGGGGQGGGGQGDQYNGSDNSGMGQQDMDQRRMQQTGNYGGGMPGMNMNMNMNMGNSGSQQDSSQRQNFSNGPSGGGGGGGGGNHNNGGTGNQPITKSEDEEDEENPKQQHQQMPNRNQQQMPPQGMGMGMGMGGMPPQFGGPGGWQGGGMGQGPFWNMSENAAAAAAAAQHLQAAAALTAGMDERSLPPALAPLASVARRMNGMNGMNGMQGGGPGDMNNVGPALVGSGGPAGPSGYGGGNNMNNMMNMNMMSPNMMNNNINNSMTQQFRGRRGDPPADPPTGSMFPGMMGGGMQHSPNHSPSSKRKGVMDGQQNDILKKMRMTKQGIFEDADEED